MISQKDPPGWSPYVVCDWPLRPLLLSSKCQRLLRELLIQTFFRDLMQSIQLIIQTLIKNLKEFSAFKYLELTFNLNLL